MPRYTKVIKKEAHSTTVGILSAGIGNKIKSYEPRSLIKVGSDSLLSYQINLINNLFTSPEIIVGVGVGAGACAGVGAVVGVSTGVGVGVDVCRCVCRCGWRCRCRCRCRRKCRCSRLLLRSLGKSWN